MTKTKQLGNLIFSYPAANRNKPGEIRPVFVATDKKAEPVQIGTLRVNGRIYNIATAKGITSHTTLGKAFGFVAREYAASQVVYLG